MDIEHLLIEAEDAYLIEHGTSEDGRELYWVVGEVETAH